MNARTGGLAAAVLATLIGWVALVGACASGVGTCCREDGQGGHIDCVSRGHRSERRWHQGRSRDPCTDGRVPAAWCPKGCAWTAGPGGTLPSCECSSGDRPRRLPASSPTAAARHTGASVTTTLLCCASGQTTESGTELFDCEIVEPAVAGSKTKCVQAGKTYKECTEPRCADGDCLCEE